MQATVSADLAPPSSSIVPDDVADELIADPVAESRSTLERDRHLEPTPTGQTPSLPRPGGFDRRWVIRVLETVQDIIVISLCFGLFCFMAVQLWNMFVSLWPPLNFKAVTADILFILILVELFRLLALYLQEHRISIGVAVEVAIVSVLREVIVRGILEIAWPQVLATCGFLLVMAALLWVRVWLPPTFEGIDPERSISQRYRSSVATLEP